MIEDAMPGMISPFFEGSVQPVVTRSRLKPSHGLAKATSEHHPEEQGNLCMNFHT
jgi:hypothetical protein